MLGAPALGEVAPQTLGVQTSAEIRADDFRKRQF